jgi:citrate lyase subunit beta/citryl-CoA lyase
MSATYSRRAMLFVPGNSKKMLEKIPSLAPGSFILDLEDSVPPSEKESARHMVGELTRGAVGDYELHVRINDVASSYAKDDLVAVMGESLAGIVVPKVERAEDIERVNRLIDETALASGRDGRGISVMATIETALGLHRVDEIAAVGGHLELLSFGSGDFALDLGLEWPSTEGTPEILLWAKSQLVLASRVAGLDPPHDGSFTNYLDLEGLGHEARQSRRLGFGGKHVVHPSQIGVVDEIFTPNARQIERANKLIEAFEEAERSGSGAVGVDGELVDYAIIKRARQLLADLDH